MGEHYQQLRLEERCTIARLREDGQSVRQIAAALDRPPSTISRELSRNSGSKRGYKPGYAQQQTQARRWCGMRLERDDALRQEVLGRLAAGWSPEQVVGQMETETGQRPISHESIYRFIDAQIRRTKDYGWRHYLPRAKSKRGWRGKPGGSPASLIKQRRPISERPATANDRLTPGHWEADFMLFAQYGQNILVAHERSTRIILLAWLPDRKAERTMHSLARLIGPWPKAMRSTLTLDNGTEFAEHYRLEDQLGIHTFFCDPHAPWQKGGVEIAIGRLRRYLPRKTNLNDITPDQLVAIANRYNNTPRKCLDFKTPAEACLAIPLHFKCESTFPPPRE
jgi:transposase, IS30 family